MDGVLPYYFYFYFGWIGVIIIAIYVSRFISMCDNLNNENNYGLKKCISVYFLISVPRWYLYSSSPLTRGVILLTIVFMINEMINKSSKNIEIEGA